MTCREGRRSQHSATGRAQVQQPTCNAAETRCLATGGQQNRQSGNWQGRKVVTVALEYSRRSQWRSGAICGYRLRLSAGTGS